MQNEYLQPFPHYSQTFLQENQWLLNNNHLQKHDVKQIMNKYEDQIANQANSQFQKQFQQQQQQPFLYRNYVQQDPMNFTDYEKINLMQNADPYQQTYQSQSGIFQSATVTANNPIQQIPLYDSFYSDKYTKDNHANFNHYFQYKQNHNQNQINPSSQANKIQAFNANQLQLTTKIPSDQSKNYEIQVTHPKDQAHIKKQQYLEPGPPSKASPMKNISFADQTMFQAPIAATTNQSQSNFQPNRQNQQTQFSYQDQQRACTQQHPCYNPQLQSFNHLMSQEGVLDPFLQQGASQFYVHSNQRINGKIQKYVDQLGGIEDTIGKMEQSLRENEMQRVQRDLGLDQMQYPCLNDKIQNDLINTYSKTYLKSKSENDKFSFFKGTKNQEAVKQQEQQNYQNLSKLKNQEQNPLLTDPSLESEQETQLFHYLNNFIDNSKKLRMEKIKQLQFNNNL